MMIWLMIEPNNWMAHNNRIENDGIYRYVFMFHDVQNFRSSIQVTFMTISSYQSLISNLVPNEIWSLN